jgi:endoglucanase
MQARLDPRFDWGNVANLGFFTYLASKRPGRDAALIGQLRKNTLLTADQLVTARGNHGYGRPLGTFYTWGCNGTVARQVMILMAANRLAPKREYTETALDALNHLFGRNYYGRSFVTGLGYLPPLHPHDRRSGGDKVAAPWPGYVIGGSNPGATSWRDDQNDFRTNEIAINWQGALIYAVAAFIQ